MRVVIINGPNLNLLGDRMPEVYGRETLEDIETLVRRRAEELDVEVAFVQSNHEGALLEAVHEHRDWDGLIINAGAYTHTSLAIADAIEAVDVPAVGGAPLQRLRARGGAARLLPLARRLGAGRGLRVPRLPGRAWTCWSAWITEEAEEESGS